MQKSNSESGIALVLTITMLLLFSVFAIHAINRVQDERVSSGASRRYTMNVSAANAGVKIALAQLKSSSGLNVNTAPIDIPALQADAFGQPTSIRSGVLNTTTPQRIQFLQFVADSSGGGQLNLGSGQGGGGQLAVYRVNIVATDPSGGSAQVQAQLMVQAPSVGY
jgi:Tfp pilus assembly protein PilX